jgi:hypothetical protein
MGNKHSCLPQQIRPNFVSTSLARFIDHIFDTFGCMPFNLHTPSLYLYFIYHIFTTLADFSNLTWFIIISSNFFRSGKHDPIS